MDAKYVYLKGQNRKMYIEKYKSYKEFVETIKEREKTYCKDSSHYLAKNWDSKDTSWIGIDNYETAESYLLNGWENHLEMMKKEIDKNINLMDNKKVIKQYSDVCGFAPIVPNALLGLPNCMLNTHKDVKKSKIIKFLFEMNKPWTYSSKQIIEKYSKILANIAILEKNGYRCRIELNGTFSNMHENQTIVGCNILVKSENQLFDVKRLCFPLVHSAMSRLFGFAWENSLPIKDNYHISGMGQALYLWNKIDRDEVLNALNERNEKIVYVSMDTDENELLKGGEAK